MRFSTNPVVIIGRKAYQDVRVFGITGQADWNFETGLARIGDEIRFLRRSNKNTWTGKPGPSGRRNIPWIDPDLLVSEGHGDLL